MYQWYSVSHLTSSDHVPYTLNLKPRANLPFLFFFFFVFTRPSPNPLPTHLFFFFLSPRFVSRYLAHPPPPGNNGSALLMLQALILELGCLPNVAAGKFSIPVLPGSLRQAKLILKGRAFINVRDYLAVREQGQAALRRVMHPSRKSLVQEVRKGKRVPVHEVKKAGLNVLLVNTRF